MKALIFVFLFLLVRLIHAQENEIIDYCIPGHKLHEKSIVLDDNSVVNQKKSVFFIDSTLFGNGNRAIIQYHNHFDVENWLKDRTSHGITKDSSYSLHDTLISQNARLRDREFNENFYYELDSLDRVVFAFRFDFNGRIVPFELLHGYEDRTSPAVFEYAYDCDNQLWYVRCFNKHFGKALEPNWGYGDIIKFYWKKKSINEIEFYNCRRQVQRWTQNKGLIETQIAPSPKEKDKNRLLEIYDREISKINNKLVDFKSDSTFFRENNPQFYGFRHDRIKDSNSINVLCDQYTTILSDTSNGIIRYLWIQPDAEIDVFYVEKGHIIKAQHRSTFGQLSTIYSHRNNYYTMVQSHDTNFYTNKNESLHRTIIAYKKTRMVVPKGWEFEYFNESRRDYDDCPDINAITDNQMDVFNNRLYNLINQIKECN